MRSEGMRSQGMTSQGIVSRLAEQLVEATRRSTWTTAEGRASRTMEAVVQSLRQTLACFVQLRSLRDVGPGAFVLLVDAEGSSQIRHAGQALPVGDAHVRQLFREAGVELLPGQAIVLVPRIVRLVAEDALAETGVEEARVRDQKRKLVEVFLTAEALENGHSPGPSPKTSEAA